MEKMVLWILLNVKLSWMMSLEVGDTWISINVETKLEPSYEKKFV